MYAAINKQRQLVNAIDGQMGEQYYCPQCWQPVQLSNTSQTTRPHFRHYAKHTDFVGETRRHVRGKLALQSALQRMGAVVEQEVILGDDERRADVLWTHQTDQYAFEFQCASLSVAELRRRHLSYQALKITDIWLLGATYLTRHLRSLRKTALKFMNYRYQWGYFIPVWFGESQTVRLFHHIAFAPPQTAVVFKYTDYSLGTFLNGYLQEVTELTELPPMSRRFDPSYWLGQQLNFQQSRWLPLQTRCYQQGMSLMNLPQQLWLPKRLPPLTRSWSIPLHQQINCYLLTGNLTWQQCSNIYLTTQWPLLK